MTTEKLKEVLGYYADWIDEVGNCAPVEHSGDGDDPTHLEHLHWMCDRAELDFVPAGEIDKAMRWLGFVQGVLCAKGYFTLAQLREHSRET